jgi:predicted membrane channel-forming protein YqfA (hemolysin III family)
LENASNDQAIYSKRLLEYNIAKDAGYDALKELATKWYSENEEIKNSASFKFGFLIGIIGLILFFIWLFF